MNKITAAPPKRLKVIETLREMLQSITHDNGYNTDVGGRVSVGVAEFGDNMVTPFLSILESPASDIGFFGGGNARRKEEWTLLIQGWIDNEFMYPDSDVDNPTRNAYYLAADVERCLAQAVAINPNRGTPKCPAWYNLAGLVNDMVIAPPVVRPPDNNSPKAWFYMALRLEMSTNIHDPYEN